MSALSYNKLIFIIIIIIINWGLIAVSYDWNDIDKLGMWDLFDYVHLNSYEIY